jgi:protein-glutamine gamma-glutamyltransferase
MSIAAGERRPQLAAEELQQVRWLLGAVLTLLGISTVFYMDVDAGIVMAITTIATIATLVWPVLPARVPRLAHQLAFPAMAIFFVLDLWLKAELLPAMVRLDILLLFYRVITYRQRRDDLQIIVLGLFLVVVAGVLTVSLIFAVQILVYTAGALAFLLVITLGENTAGVAGHLGPAGERGRPPAWVTHVNWPRLLGRLHRTTDWRVVALGGALFAGLVVLSAGLFLVIPRFQLENGLFLDRLITKKARTGFSDSIKFGDVTDIQQDTGVALNVDVSDPTQIPASPYWRMIVLDEYQDGTFKASRWREQQPTEREQTSVVARGTLRRRRAPPVYWTIFLESGVSRYLPLLGGFSELRFREVQSFRFNRELSVLALREEPVTMTAYQVSGFDSSGRLPDAVFGREWSVKAPGARTISEGSLSGLSTTDRARLAAMVDEISAGQRLDAGAFAGAATAWLRRQHNYSLNPRIPAGTGDPLVRWTGSRESGHCELFAGALAMLARTAGFPARVVTGFRGGIWNAFSNSFTVRNSDAHAWAEIFDPAASTWFRADALGAAIAAEAVEAGAAGEAARRIDRSWSARLNSLRVFWYRRIVNFDQRTQAETLQALKTATQKSGQQLREQAEKMMNTLRRWFTSPWNVRRLVVIFVPAAMFAAIVWAWRYFAWSTLLLRWRRTARREDPVRAEAGVWLRRLARQRGQDIGLVAELQRLRFGAARTWPNPAPVFRAARRQLRIARRRPRVTSA